MKNSKENFMNCNGGRFAKRQALGGAIVSGNLQTYYTIENIMCQCIIGKKLKKVNTDG